jgi:fermentation-respiration switch protein FrsA (DUF1100 family)
MVMSVSVAVFRSALLAILCIAVAACTAQVSERGLLTPVSGGLLSQDALAKAAPVYTATHLDFVAPDGIHLYGVHLRQPNARATILYFGGNGYTIGRFGPWTASVFAPLGVDLVIVDHRGYGQSQGVPGIAAMESDALVVFDRVAALPGVNGRPIVVHGHSLGSFIAGYVAAHRPAAGVVLESSVTTAEDWVKAATPSAARLFVKVRLADELRGRGNLANMALIEEPLLLLVGAKDGTTPPSLSQALYAASPLAPDRKTLTIVPKAGHTDSMERIEAIAAYRRFLDSILR